MWKSKRKELRKYTECTENELRMCQQRIKKVLNAGNVESKEFKRLRKYLESDRKTITVPGSNGNVTGESQKSSKRELWKYQESSWIVLSTGNVIVKKMENTEKTPENYGKNKKKYSKSYMKETGK